MKQTIWRIVAFVVGIPLAYLLIWIILLATAHYFKFSVSDAGSLLSVLGGIMGAIFTVGGLIIALVAVLTQIQLQDRVERVVEDAKQSVVNKFEKELRSEYEKQIQQQVAGMLAFFQATNAQDWKQAVKYTCEALQKYKDLPGARTFLGLRLSNEVQAHFSYQLHPGTSPLALESLGGPVTRLYHTQFVYTHPAPPKLEAIHWLKEALQYEDDPEGNVTAALALIYGYSEAYDLMIDTIKKAVIINPSLTSYFQRPDNLMTLIYACDNLDSIKEVMHMLSTKLPEIDEIQQAIKQALDPKSNPYVRVSLIEWYAIEMKAGSISRTPVKVLLAIPGKDGLTYAQISKKGQVPITIPTQPTSYSIETLIPVDEILKQLTDNGIVLITLI